MTIAVYWDVKHQIKQKICVGSDFLLNLSMSGGHLLKVDKSRVRNANDLSTYD